MKKVLGRNWEKHDTIKDDMEVETESNDFEPFEEYVIQVEVKQLKLTKR